MSIYAVYVKIYEKPRKTELQTHRAYISYI